MSVLDCFNLTQNVTFATHSRGHILDLICTSGLNNILVNGSDFVFSDHKLINFSCSFPIFISPQKKMLTYRKINSVNSTSFSASIRASTLSECLLSNCPSEVCCIYNNALSQILEIRGGRKKIDPSMHRDSLSNGSGSILRISESILSLVFNQMCNTEFALETPVFCLLPITHIGLHTPLEPSVK